MIFLDAASGTKPHHEVITTITDVLENHWGNASANNSHGQDARNIIYNVTQQVADDINCDSSEIIWTSGACEANSLAIRGVLEANEDMILCITRLEHTSIKMASHYTPMHVIYVLSNDKFGYIQLDRLEKTLAEVSRRFGNPFVSISYANSEIGVIQRIKPIAEMIHKYNGLLHVDATQMYPWFSIDVQDLGIDLMSVSGQKMNCVKGIGFLYVKNGIELCPLIHGSQQDERRGGTMPTHLIAAFGKALEITRSGMKTEIVKAYRDSLLDSLMQIDGVHLNGPRHDTNGVLPDKLRLPNNISLTIDGVKAETLVTMCDLMGVIIGKGSACKSYEPKPSDALLAIGLTEEQALNTVRITLDDNITRHEIIEAANIIAKLVERIREDEE